MSYSPGDTNQMTEDISETLQRIDLRKPVLSTLAQKGDDQLVSQFLSENVKLGLAKHETIQSQLYIAAFWGFYDVVKKLLEIGANPNFQNSNTKWTPLHAATFQEHGKIIMLLLESGSDPELTDFEGRSGKDFGSASDRIWPLFAARGCKRVPKHILIEKGVLQKPTGGPVERDTGRKSTAASLLKFDDDEPTQGYEGSNLQAAAAHGDVLAGAQEKMTPFSPQQQKKGGDQPNFAAWRT